MKRMLKHTAIACGIFWLFYLAQVCILLGLREEWMLLGILLIMTQRLTLWLSPFAVSGIVWIAGALSKCSAWKCFLLNLAVLAVNMGCFLANHCLTGGWY